MQPNFPLTLVKNVLLSLSFPLSLALLGLDDPLDSRDQKQNIRSQSTGQNGSLGTGIATTSFPFVAVRIRNHEQAGTPSETQGDCWAEGLPIHCAPAMSSPSCLYLAGTSGRASKLVDRSHTAQSTTALSIRTKPYHLISLSYCKIHHK